jgi:hypothetical protein
MFFSHMVITISYGVITFKYYLCQPKVDSIKQKMNQEVEVKVNEAKKIIMGEYFNKNE